jgi:hypothetical protein
MYLIELFSFSGGRLYYCTTELVGWQPVGSVQNDHRTDDQPTTPVMVLSFWSFCRSPSAPMVTSILVTAGFLHEGVRLALKVGMKAPR